MKNYKRYLAAVSLCCAAAVSGCSDISKTYEDYRGDSETVYVGKVDQAVMRPGNLRTQFEGLMNYAVTAQKLVLEWGEDQRIFDIADIAVDGGSRCEALIDGLAEGDYRFTYYTLDRDGNRSVKQTLEVFVFGAEYIASQTPRLIEKFGIMPDGSAEIIFGQTTGYAEVVLTYKDAGGESQTVVVTPAMASVVIESFEPGSEMTISYEACPSAISLDRAVIATDTYTFPALVDRSGLTDMALASDAAQGHDGVVGNLWDGDNNTVMHSAANVGVPSHVTIDMGAERMLVHGRVEMRDIYTWCPYQFQLWGLPELANGKTIADYEPSVADDLAGSGQWETESLALGWINLTDNGAANYATRTNNSLSANFDLYGGTKVRYLRYRALKVWNDESAKSGPVEGSGAYFCTGELYLFEQAGD